MEIGFWCSQQQKQRRKRMPIANEKALVKKEEEVWEKKDPYSHGWGDGD